jgi:[ribosomal protein S18]-alanine N-acetyltransferase
MLPEVLRIQAEGFETRSSDKLIKNSKRLKKIFYVIKSQNQVVGYSIYYIKPALSFKGLKKKSLICSIAIDKNFRGRGFATRLLNESIREMRLNKIESVLLYVNVNNVPAIKLYEKLGFRMTKEMKNICGQNEKCYEMELNITFADVHFQRALTHEESREEIAEAIAVAVIAGSSQLGWTNVYGEQVYRLILERKKYEEMKKEKDVAMGVVSVNY